MDSVSGSVVVSVSASFSGVRVSVVEALVSFSPAAVVTGGGGLVLCGALVASAGV